MSKDEKKEYEKPLKLDMDLEEAVDRFVKVTKEEVEEKQVQGELVLHEGDSQLAMFRGKEIRQIFHDNEWFFSVVDVVKAITESDRPGKYWSDLKKKLTDQEDFVELSEKIGQLPLPSSDGKSYKTDVMNTETLFRVVQSIPSKKAEPFKKWLAKVGYERIQEIQDPEIAIKRAMLTYKAKGYTDDWVNKRLQTIISRKEVTHEWQKRGVEGKQYGVLTNIISKGTFGVDTNQHKDHKNLKGSHNLRDHMTPLELALTMLGETTTAEMAKNSDAQGFHENKQAAKTGGDVAGSARKDIEKRTGKKIVSEENFLPESKQGKLT